MEGIRPQLDVIDRSTRRKTLGVRLRSTETQPTYDPRPGLDPGHRGGRCG